MLRGLREISMRKFGVAYNGGGKRLLTAVGLMAFAAGTSLIAASAKLSDAQSQTQNTDAIKFEFTVASVKPNKSGGAFKSLDAIRAVALNDGFNVTNVTLMDLIRVAYGLNWGMGDEARVSGAPSW